MLWGGILILLMTGSMLTLVRRFVSRFGLPLVILSLLWLSWHFVGVAQQQGLDALLARPGTGGHEHAVGGGLGHGHAHLVAALGGRLSHATAHRAAAPCAAHGSDMRWPTPGATPSACWWPVCLNPAPTWWRPCCWHKAACWRLGLILLDELDNAYGDVYSGAVSSQQLVFGDWSLRRWGMLIAAICTALAMVLPMHSLEPFLLTLSSIFVPLYGVILGRLCSGAVVTAGLTDPVNAGKRVDVVAAGIWISGIAVFPCIRSTGHRIWVRCHSQPDRDLCTGHGDPPIRAESGSRIRASQQARQVFEKILPPLSKQARNHPIIQSYSSIAQSVERRTVNP